MRILTVRFQNLNSLFGKWEIDLSAMAQEGIFAITGPTGSGKTTILDAICLALYGRTPRLSSVTKGENEIMSRGTGECFAEVEFETQKGRFRCHWSQHRARRIPEGELQQPRHEISDLASRRILEFRIRDVAAMVESVTGMDFDRFTRSVLLAQGGFSAFLRASPSERAPILEQITGTEVYSRISVAVHDRCKAEKEILGRLKGEVREIKVLDRDREEEMILKLEALSVRENDLRAEADGLKASLLWLKGIEDLKAELELLEKERSGLLKDRSDFGPEAARLNLAKKAAGLEPLYSRYCGLRGEHNRDRKRLAEKEAALPVLCRALEEKARSLVAAEQKVLAAREALKNSGPGLKEARSMDRDIAFLKERAEASEKRLREARSETLAQKNARERAGAQALKARDDRDRWFKKLRETREKLSGVLKGRTLREYRSEKEFLIKEAAYRARIADLEAQRAELLDGEPCPLCGSRDHPFTKGLPPKPMDDGREKALARLIAWAETLEEAIGDLEKKAAGASERLLAMEGDIKGLDGLLESHKSALQSQIRDLEILKARIESIVLVRRKLYGEKDPDLEEKNLTEAVVSAENREKTERRVHQELLLKYERARADAESLKKALKDREPGLMELKMSFNSALASHGFPHEESLKNAMMPAGEREALAAKARELDDREVDIEARRRDRKGRLERELSKKITGGSARDLRSHLEEIEGAVEEARGAAAKLRAVLDENLRFKARLREKGQEILKQEKEARRWSDLHELIGSSDGKKYRNYAQGLTFQALVAHANDQLQKMTDRYLLVLDKNESLELAVLDSYGEGGFRSTKNLSGGESFIVSLALALGLSRMAGKNVRVDSLFLDEGFGTLDQESLDMALDTLAELRQEGKVIGVISHLPAIYDRIGSKISVIPGTGGRSRISGPGCRMVTAWS